MYKPGASYDNCPNAAGRYVVRMFDDILVKQQRNGQLHANRRPYN